MTSFGGETEKGVVKLNISNYEFYIIVKALVHLFNITNMHITTFEKDTEIELKVKRSDKI